MANDQVGIYRATVLNTQDPMRRGRVQLMIPGASHPISGWAEACLSPGTSIASVKVGDDGWAMFEGGDISNPVFLGIRPS